MAYYSIFPEKDATTYSFYPYMNTGIDAIIETTNLNVNIKVKWKKNVETGIKLKLFNINQAKKEIGNGFQV